MLVEETLILRLRFRKILIPLGWEEFCHIARDTSWILLLKLFNTSNTLMKILVADYARQRDMITSSVHFFQI